MKFKKRKFRKANYKSSKRSFLVQKKCVMSNQRPRIIFDENQVCSGCKNNDLKIL